MIYRVLDIEAVADESVWTKPAPSYKVVPLVTYRNLDSVFSDLGKPALEQVEQFPPAHAWRVVALSCVDVEFNPANPVPYAFRGARSVCLWAPGASGKEQDAKEREILDMFNDSMAKYEGLPPGAAATLVTWNGRTYDLPVIMMRCLKYGISCGWYYKSRGMRYRFTEDGHLDLMDFLGDYGAAKNMKLADVAHLVGLPGKTDTKGDQVEALYKEAAEHPEKEPEICERIARYCQQDTVQTALIFLRTLILRGMLAPAAHDAAVDTFSESEVVRKCVSIDWPRLKVGGAA